MIKLSGLVSPVVIGKAIGSKNSVKEDVLPTDKDVNVAQGLPHTEPSADTKKYTLTRENLKNIVREVMKEEGEYQKVFHKLLNKFGVNSPAELSDEQKKKFFNLAKGVQTELKERQKMKEAELKGGQHKLDVDGDGEIEGSDLAALRAKKNENKKVNKRK